MVAEEGANRSFLKDRCDSNARRAQPLSANPGATGRPAPSSELRGFSKSSRGSYHHQHRPASTRNLRRQGALGGRDASLRPPRCGAGTAATAGTAGPGRAVNRIDPSR